EIFGMRDLRKTSSWEERCTKFVTRLYASWSGPRSDWHQGLAKESQLEAPVGSIAGYENGFGL
ncbi:hypothetical protein BaRGS_00021888, partial [Batillaria attramentaria]